MKIAWHCAEGRYRLWQHGAAGEERQRSAHHSGRDREDSGGAQAEGGRRSGEGAAEQDGAPGQQLAAGSGQQAARGAPETWPCCECLSTAWPLWTHAAQYLLFLVHQNGCCTDSGRKLTDCVTLPSQPWSFTLPAPYLQANGLSSPRLGQLLAKQHPLHKQEQQPAPLHAPKANGHSEQPGMPQGLHAGMLQALIDSMKKQSKHGAQPAGQNIQAGATAVNVALAAASQEHLAESGAQPSTEWYAPPEMAFQLEADMAPGRGQDSAERAVQQLRQRREVMQPVLLCPVRSSD